MYNWSALLRLCINSVPGVMTFESNEVSPLDDGLSLNFIPSSAHFVFIEAVRSAFSWASNAVLNLLDLC